MPTDRLVISVIVPTHNRLTILRRTLERIKKQTIGRDRYEVIVVDDASRDGTWEYLQSLNDVRRFRNPVNRGRAATRNVGTTQARSGLLLFIDDDVWADQNLLHAHIAMHQANRERDVAVVGAIRVSPDIARTAINLYQNRKHEWCLREMGRCGADLPYGFCKTANLSIGKKLLQDIGLFNEMFSGYGGEDTDLGYRLLMRGGSLVFAPEAVGYHHHDDTVEAMIAREKERAGSISLFRRLHPESRETYSGFFTPQYHAKGGIRTICYNIVKLLAFTPVARAANRTLVVRWNNRALLRGALVRFFLPLLRIQYGRHFARVISHENRH